jgi:hypothetical protein
MLAALLDGRALAVAAGGEEGFRKLFGLTTRFVADLAPSEGDAARVWTTGGAPTARVATSSTAEGIRVHPRPIPSQTVESNRKRSGHPCRPEGARAFRPPAGPSGHIAC